MKINKIQNYFFELIIIFVGISASFLLNEWRENRKNNEEEISYLENLKSDLISDTIAIQNEINIINGIIYSCNKSLNYDREKGNSKDSISYYLHYMLQYSVIPIRNITYKTLTRTGDSKLISNRNLLRKIIELYEVGYFNIREYNKIDENLILNRLIPYYEQNFKSYGQEVKKDAPITYKFSFQFKNLIKSNLNFKKIQKTLYKDQITNIQKLIIDIEEELERSK